jgi:hypothetical protein
MPHLMLRYTLVAALLTVTVGPAAPQALKPAAGSAAVTTDDAFALLIATRSLKCTFGQGSHAEWKEGALTIGTGRFSAPGAESAIYYDSINRATRKAEIKKWNCGLGHLSYRLSQSVFRQ